MNKEEYSPNPHSVGTGKVFVGKSILEITEKTYKDRNINFRKYAKGLMLGMMAHNEYKTLNLERKTYQITLTLNIVPGKVVVPQIVPKKRKIELIGKANKKIEEAKKLIGKEKLIKVVR